MEVDCSGLGDFDDDYLTTFKKVDCQASTIDKNYFRDPHEEILQRE